MNVRINRDKLQHAIRFPVFNENEYKNPVTGAQLISSFRVDFKIADKFGADAIIDTYNRAKSEWKHQPEYMSELVLTLYWAATEQLPINKEYSKLYLKLWRECHTFCCNHFKNDDLTKYYNKLN